MSNKRFSDDTHGRSLFGFNWDFSMFCQSSMKEKSECPGTFQRVGYDARNTYRESDLVIDSRKAGRFVTRTFTK